MSTEVKEQTYSDLLANIEDFYTENAVNVFCPIANLDLKFKPLTVKQLKKFIELQVSAEKDEFGIIPGIDTVKHVNLVLKENCIDFKNEYFQTLTPVDRDAIVLQLRANVKSQAEVVAGEDDTDTVDLNKIVSKVKKTRFKAKDRRRVKTFDYAKGKLTLNLRIPNVLIDGIVNEHFKDKISPALKKGRKHIEKQVDTVLSTVYFLEISKYIETIDVTRDGALTTIGFDDPDSLDASLELLEKLPSSIVAEASNYIQDIKQWRDTAFSYVDGNGTVKPVNVDISLFTGI
jgi:hypothetical protein